MFAGLEKSLSNLVAEKMAHEENKRKGASGTLNRRNALDVTYLIEATSTNRMCQFILSHVKKASLAYVNNVLNTNPIIRSLSQGLKYEHFEGTLISYPTKQVGEIIAWIVFWSDFVSGVLEDFDPNIRETVQCCISGMPYENYCTELGKFEKEIEAIMGPYIFQELKDTATFFFDTVE
ncbi:unnamed protein product [Hymenolepis diminuta]|nr:unnamed protein product [Hymenolepis diminuta]